MSFNEEFSMLDSEPSVSPTFTQQLSLTNLIVWNISKAVEKEPRIDLKRAMKAAQERLESTGDVNSIVSQRAEERHLACAFLAWQQLGHNSTDSLCKFIDEVQAQESKEQYCSSLDSSHIDVIKMPNIFSKTSHTISTHSPGPVIRLPVETKIIMRMDNACGKEGDKEKPRSSNRSKKEIMDKINAACCQETGCVERLAALGSSVSELRARAVSLAKREAERVKLLERAETAWRDLEHGYQKRLQLAEEKEEDIMRQTAKLIEERNAFKNSCNRVALENRDDGDKAQEDRDQLTNVEKDLYDRARERLSLLEQVAKEDTALAEEQCKSAQLDRDLQFKEDQGRRKVACLQSEVDTALGLMHEAERAMRAELNALRDQVGDISQQLLKEDSDIVEITQELQDLRNEKMELIEDLEGCKDMCDIKMQNKVDKLQKKKDELDALKEKVMECRCLMPVDKVVEAKRTSSLAALCQCTPADKILESCSCTSLRGRLLSSLLSDLFGGLQSELGNVGLEMPCQLLKCLEDKHNWDRASVVKSSLRNYFTQMLLNELDIAIATAIEKYHAKWTGETCADNLKTLVHPDDLEWQQQAIERQAQKLAERLAEQMFQEKAEELAERATKIVTAKGMNPCSCEDDDATTALFPCLVSPHRHTNSRAHPIPKSARRNSQNITQFRTEVETTKKETTQEPKKADQKLKEPTKHCKHSSNNACQNPECEDYVCRDKDTVETSTRREYKPRRYGLNLSRACSTKKKIADASTSKALKSPPSPNALSKPINKLYKRPPQSYAVNLCLCSKDQDKLSVPKKTTNNNKYEEAKDVTKLSTEVVCQIASIKQTKPIILNDTPDVESSSLKTSKTPSPPTCKSNYACFHKIPSNRSIDELLNTLIKWNCELNNVPAPTVRKVAPKCLSIGVSNINKVTEDLSTFKSEAKLIEHENKTSTTAQKTASKGISKKSYLTSQTTGDMTDTIEFDRRIPTNTQSEYMGAVNLDKSNENFCKCVFPNDPQKELNESVSSHFHFKCINSCSCYNKLIESKSNSQLERSKSGTKENRSKISNINKPSNDNNEAIKIMRNQENIQGDSLVVESFVNTPVKNISKLFTDQTTSYANTCLAKLSEKATSFSKSSVFNNIESRQRSVNVDAYIKKPEYDINNKNFEDKHTAKTCESIPPDGDFHIELLGVTLTDTNSKEFTKTKKNFRKYYQDGLSNLHSDSVSKSDKNKDLKDTKIVNDLQSTCHCDIKLEDIRKRINKSLKTHGDNKDEALDTDSLRETIVIDAEPCVCCPNDEKEEANELEVNTFYLLENHLKEKFDELKLSCTSSCISPKLEDKVFSGLLSKIKHIITDNTKKVSCKCSNEYQTEGSWNRACTLLQEYLKAKLNHVQCECSSPKESKKEFLPEVTGQVCDLIEEDFKRLKEICKCKDPPIEVKEIEHMLPDTNDVNENTEVKLKISSNKINDQATATDKYQNVSFSLDMKNEACEATDTEILNMQTVQPHTNVKECDSPDKDTGNYNDIKVEISPAKQIIINRFTDYVRHNDILNLNNEDLFPNNVYRAIHEIKNVHAEEGQMLKADNYYVKSPEIDRSGIILVKKEADLGNKTDLPYFGYTVNCTCDFNLGYCVCAKSIVQKTNDGIDRLYKSAANTRKYDKNISYMLENINKESDKLNFIEPVIVEDLYEPTLPQKDSIPQLRKNICNMQSSAHGDVNLIIKDSKNKDYSPKDFTTDTLMDDIASFEISCDENNWYECGSQNEHEHLVAKNKSVHFPLGRSVKYINEEAFSNNVICSRDSQAKSHDCDCGMVPICHVKMLVENIETKLAHAECTCDSLSFKVCPVHSKKMNFD